HLAGKGRWLELNPTDLHPVKRATVRSSMNYYTICLSIPVMLWKNLQNLTHTTHILNKE
ncbi:hypothetical protein H4684_003955, partial [Desulfomicrobium macestii]|nr:hypothetical protein [Desulfomicrobium macestii]